MLKLAFDLDFPDLYRLDGLQRVDAAFTASLAAVGAGLSVRLEAARAAVATIDAKVESDLLIDLAPHVDRFVGALEAKTALSIALLSPHWRGTGRLSNYVGANRLRRRFTPAIQ